MNVVPPNILYKYFRFDEYKSMDNLFNDKKLYFRRPNFNDPFDTKINFDINLSLAEKVQFAKKMARYNVKNNNSNYNAEFRKFFKGFSNQSLKENIYKSIQSSTFLCLSEERSNLLMWAHYADCHKGICVGFDFADVNLFNGIVPLKVNYTQNYPCDKLDVENFIDNVILTKSKDWAYENEWRLIFTNTQPNFKFINSWNIREVIFGCCIDQENLKTTKALLTKREFAHLKIYIAEKSLNKFQLELKQISI